jgi:23S rRNA (guanosine2251-2'-O)-methyltransferase
MRPGKSFILENFIFGIHPLIEALDSGEKPEKILIQKGLQGDNFMRLFHRIRQEKIPFQMVPVEKLNRITRKNHQGIIAFVSLVAYQPLQELLPMLYDRGKTPLLVMLDRVTDVRNLGAIARSVECAGAHAIIIQEKGTAPINADAIKASAGALSRIPICRENNLLESIAFLQASGIRVVACSERGDNTIYQDNLSVPTAIILGAEDKGISAACLKMSDARLRIPMQGHIGSLNVSVAAGVVLFEALRQRNIS